MKKIPIIICLALTLAETLAQDSPTRMKGIHLDYTYQTSFGNGFKVGNLTAGIFIQSRENTNFHEVELNTFQLLLSEVPGERELFNGLIGLRYQYTFSFRPGKKVEPQIGLSWLTQYRFGRNVPLTPLEYERRWRHIDFQWAVVPQLRYNFSSRWFTDLAIPFEVFQLVGTFQRIYNPQIPVRQQRNGGYDHEFFRRPEMYSLRLGVGFKI
jgi:hypothetical protein